MNIYPMFMKYFHFYKTRVILCMIFSFFEKKKILITAEENTWPFQRLEHYLEREIQGMLKSVTTRRNKKILRNIFLIKSNYPILTRVVLACLGYFWFILPRSWLFQLATISYGLFHI